MTVDYSNLTYHIEKYPTRCPNCGSKNATAWYETWSDGFCYYEKSCKECGWCVIE